MGKTVLCLCGAFIIGTLMVAGAAFIAIVSYAGLSDPDEFSLEAFLSGSYTGFVCYLVPLWAMQETLEDQVKLRWRILLFLVSPAGIMYWYVGQGILTSSAAALSLIAAVPAYQMLMSCFGQAEEVAT